MDRLLQDLRFALRLLVRDRTFTLTTTGTLAVCLAANTAMFAIVHSVLLRPLPFDEPDRLVAIFNAYPGAGVLRAANGVPDYYDRKASVAAFEEIANYRNAGVTIGGQGQGEAERLTSMQVTPSFFRVLRAAAFRGRLLTDEEAEPGRERKVVLSYGLWQRVFGGQDAAVGRDLRINGTPYVVVGVLPQGWHFLDPEVQLWMPVAYTAEQRADDQRHSNNWQQMARLKPGATIEQAQAQIDAINAKNMDLIPQIKEALINAGFHTRVLNFQEDLVESSRRTLYLLWGGVLLVLAVGCVNIANLVSVRASARLRELATRYALGAGLGRLSRQIVTETVVLAAVGGAFGVALGRWMLTAAPLLGMDRLPRGADVALDRTSMVFAFALVLAVGLIVGLLPVLALGRTNLGQMVREEGRSGTASRGARAVRRALAAGQVAFALTLLVGAGALLASFQRILAVDPGFDPNQTVSGAVALPASNYPDEASVRPTLARILAGVRAIPGVEAAGLTTGLPMTGDHSDSVILAEGYQMAPGESLISPVQSRVSDGYFEAMKIRLVRGRYFDARDHERAPRVIIIDERLANKFWPGRDPVGRHMWQPSSAETLMKPPPVEEWFTVVGVVGEVRDAGLVDRPEFRRVGAYYFPMAQSAIRAAALVVRTAQEPASMTASIRRAVAEVDPELPFFNVRTMKERVDQSLADRRTPMILALGFSAAALLLSAIGLYGVLAYQVSERRREIGVRIALGARTATIFGMVVSEGALIVAVGAVFGLLGAFGLRGALQSQLYETGAMDPGVVFAVSSLLLVVALAACLVPARRAARTDPVIALTA
jgi:predicted permease